MRVVGKRLVYLISLSLLAVTNIWSYKATSFNSLLAASIVSGFAASAGRATVPAVVADLFTQGAASQYLVKLGAFENLDRT